MKNQTGVYASKEIICLKLYEPVINLDEQSDGACCFCNAGRTVLRELEVEMDEYEHLLEGKRNSTVLRQFLF